ncbi:MFS transporter [Lysobacter daejeonensis GH1-9]|uniref:MFS transporter n=1 Tax=Lysobacter daejeonensis GH1-9 TaxID=1385517 RepID=A0A0A0F4D1_9GAMM|nr:MFS transporter [Lysobacter daejeonensis]KGM56247.1 MFS transporter [Lysobacter daejeonensis GH1-9]
MSQVSPPPQTAAPGPWSPLGQPTFRSLWLAILTSSIGTSVHDVAASWVMAENTGSPFMVAAVQAATTLPVVLLAVIAGTLADIVDRRRYLLLAQLWMLSVASALALLAQLGQLGPWTLVALTFALGVGAAMAMPAQQATTPELVPRPMLGPAVALGSLSINIARSVGPALGGLIVSHWGVAWAFAVNALSFCGVVLVLWRWKRQPEQHALPPESFGSALRAGLRYALHASVFQSVLVKAALFFAFASALTALLPIVVKQELGGGAGTYGLLLGCVGIGAISGALLLPKLRLRIDPDRLVLAATLAYAGCMATVALVREIRVLLAVSLVNGFAWICVLSSLQIAAQTSVPAWVRARALSLYIVVFSAGMATGSLFWGGLAQQQTTTFALLAAAACATVAAVVGLRFRLGAAAKVDTLPSGHWPQPLVLMEKEERDCGPVLVTVEYTVVLERREAFLQLMQSLGKTRRRDGAVQWGVMEDTEQPGTYLEYFVVASWLEHLRQHERVTHDERRLQERVLEQLRAQATPRVRHFVGGAPGRPLEALPRDHTEL